VKSIVYIPILLENNEVECSSLPPVVGRPLWSKEELDAFLRIADSLSDWQDDDARKIVIDGKESGEQYFIPFSSSLPTDIQHAANGSNSFFLLDQLGSVPGVHREVSSALSSLRDQAKN
jgi:hypothetical protein